MSHSRETVCSKMWCVLIKSCIFAKNSLHVPVETCLPVVSIVISKINKFHRDILKFCEIIHKEGRKIGKINKFHRDILKFCEIIHKEGRKIGNDLETDVV